MEVLITTKIEGEKIKWPVYTKVAGVTGKNDDGESRQDILADCEVGDELVLVRDECNEYDENAIEVLTMGFEQIGYIKRTLAAKLAPLMDDKQELYCEIENITGGEEGKETLGCNIKIEPTDMVPKPTKTATTNAPVEEVEPPEKPSALRLVLRRIWKGFMITTCIIILLFAVLVIIALRS